MITKAENAAIDKLTSQFKDVPQRDIKNAVCKGARAVQDLLERNLVPHTTAVAAAHEVAVTLG